jgi:hypothetical protein
MDPALDLPQVLLQVGYTGVFLLLGGVTLGIGYLTWADWRDRRRRAQDIPPPRKVNKRK